MAIIKVHKRNRFVVVDNKLARNRQLTLKAKGLMLYLLSLPANKDITIKELGKNTIEGKDSLKNAVRELISEGYITKLKYRDKKGLFRTEYTVYEYPQETNQGGLSDAGEPTRIIRRGSSDADNPHFRSKERIINKEEKKGFDISSSSFDINRELQILGISEDEIKKILEKIDDDEKLKLLNEKIRLIKQIETTGTVKHLTAYAIKVIRNINYNQIELKNTEKRQKSILKAEKRKRDLELMKKERKEWQEDMQRRKEEKEDMSEVVSNFTKNV